MKHVVIEIIDIISKRKVTLRRSPGSHLPGLFLMFETISKLSFCLPISAITIKLIIKENGDGRRIMGFTIYARMKRAGKQKAADLTPVPFELERRPETMRELLILLVQQSAREYNGRKDEGQILNYLTKAQIDGLASVGKISFGVHGGNLANEEAAAENALQCFEDGIYRVFAGEKELTEMEQAIPWEHDGGGGELVFTFIRLTMLSGW